MNNVEKIRKSLPVESQKTEHPIIQGISLVILTTLASGIFGFLVYLNSTYATGKELQSVDHRIDRVVESMNKRFDKVDERLIRLDDKIDRLIEKKQ